MARSCCYLTRGAELCQEAGSPTAGAAGHGRGEGAGHCTPCDTSAEPCMAKLHMASVLITKGNSVVSLAKRASDRTCKLPNHWQHCATHSTGSHRCGLSRRSLRAARKGLRSPEHSCHTQQPPVAQATVCGWPRSAGQQVSELRYKSQTAPELSVGVHGLSSLVSNVGRACRSRAPHAGRTRRSTPAVRGIAVCAYSLIQRIVSTAVVAVVSSLDA